MDTSQTSNSRLTWVVAGVIVLGLAALLIGSNTGDGTLTDSSVSDINEVAAPTEEAPADVLSGSVASQGATAIQTTGPLLLISDYDLALPYQAAADKYAPMLVTFYGCQAWPSQMEYKNKSKLMLDNRGSADLTMAIGGQTFILPAYDFGFVRLVANTFPTTYPITCGGRQIGAITMVK